MIKIEQRENNPHWLNITDGYLKIDTIQHVSPVAMRQGADITTHYFIGITTKGSPQPILIKCETKAEMEDAVDRIMTLLDIYYRTYHDSTSRGNLQSDPE